MNKLYLLFLFFTCSQQGFAQNWQQEYQGQSAQEANYVLENNDGTYTILGDVTAADDGNKDLWLFTVDTDGTLISQRIFGDAEESDVPYGLLKENDHFWALSQNALYKTDAIGDVIFSIPLTIDERANGMTFTNDGNIMLVSYTTPPPLSFPRATVTKIDLDGNVLFKKVLEDDQDMDKVILPRGISAATDGGFLVHASNFSTYDDVLYRLDANGDIVWQQNHSWSEYGGTKDAIEKSNGNFIIGGFYADSLLQNHLYEIDTNGEVVWENTYTVRGSNSEYYGGLTQTNDGNYVFITFDNNESGDGNYYSLNKIGPLGNLLWRQDYGLNDGYLYNQARNIIETTSGDLLVVGGIRNDFNGNIAFANKVNSEGLLIPNCTDNNINLNSQAAVDAWPGCTIVNGTISIDGADITDLSPLSGLTRAGNLYLLNTNISNLNGLENLTQVDTAFVIVYDSQLSDISALSNLTTVGDFFYFLGLNSLTNLDGLQSFTTASTLYLDDNDNLTDISALSNIQQINNFQLIGNDALTNINGFENITTLSNGAIIASNNALNDLSGFSNLTDVSGTFVIASNFSLPNLDGLENLSTVDGNVYISNDSSLVNVNALSNLTTVTGDFYLDSNIALQECCGVFPLLSEGTVGNFVVENNLNCNSPFEITTICTPDDCATNVTLSSQAEVDNWIGCTTIGEVLSISGDDITDLSPLSSLTEIGAVLSINNNPMLESLAGLENLQSVGFTITMGNNNALTDISALSGINSIQGQLVISDNDALTNLNGLQNLSDANDILIINNNALTDMSALDGVENIGGFLHVIDNENLVSIDAYNQLTEIPNQLIISANPNLTNFNAFQNVESVGDVLVIVQNPALQNLDGLENLASVTGQVVIENNTVLSNIDALSNLLTIGGSLSIQDNTSLNECCGVYPVLSTTGVTSSTIINNAPNCNGINVVLSVCQVNDCNLDVILESQAEVDAWLGCEDVLGILTIRGEDIVDLSPLSTLQQVFSLNIESNPLLTSLNGLQNIQAINGSLVVVSNELLTDISALQNVQTINGGFVFVQNNSLVDLSGLSSLTEVGANSFNYIYNNASLTSLNGLQNLSNIETISIESSPSLSDISALTNASTNLQNLQIIGNTNLTTLDGLENLVNINLLIIANNTTLNNLDALSNLETVNDNFVIASNPNLVSIEGLQALADVRSFIITDNAILSNLNGLENLSEVDNLQITDNPNLSNCCGIYPLLNNGIVSNSPIISNNPSPCSNQTQVLSFCDDGMLTGPDIELNISANLSNYGIYRDVLFTIEVSNTGTETATNIRTDAPGFTGTGFNQDVVLTGFRNLSPQIPSFFGSVARFIEIPALAPGETVRYEVAMFTLVEDQILEFRGQVTAMDGVDIDSAPGFSFFDAPNEDDEALVVLSPIDNNTAFADLELYMSSDFSAVALGDEVTYTVSLTNNGPVAASGITVSHFDLLNQSYLNHTLTGGNYDPASQVWTIGNLAVGNTATLNYTVLTDAISQNEVNFVHFQVQTVDQNDLDSSPANVFVYNTHQYGHEDDEAILYLPFAEDIPNENPDLELTLEVDNPNYTKFDYVTYTLTVNNTGDAIANNVKIDWQVPEGFAYHNAIVSSGDYFSWSGEWFIYQGIEPGTSESIEFTVWTNVEGVPITSYAQVVAMAGADTDSSVGNGTCCIANEDDEAAVTIGINFQDNIQNRTSIGYNQQQQIVLHNVFPNPAIDKVNFTLTSIADEAIHFIVYNVQGTSVKKGSLEAGQGIKELQLNIENYPTGTYYIKFNTNTFHHPVRFIKQQM